MPLRRLMTSSWPAMVATAVGIIAILLTYDVRALDLVQFTFYLAIAVALPGVFTWRLLLQKFHTKDEDRPTWFEDLSFGTILGFGIQLPLYLLGVWIDLPLLFWILPVVALVVSATRLGRSIWALPTNRLDPRASWALGAIILYGLYWLARNTFTMRPLSLPANQTPSVDETFHQALIAEAAHRFPPQIPFLLHTRLDYHWFGHAQIATSDHATGISSVVMLRELMPAVALALTVLGLGAVALRLTGRPIAAVIAPGLLVAGAFNLIGPHYESWVFTEPYMSKRFISSPSQSYGIMMSLPALMLILEVLRPDRKARRLTWTTLAITLLALSGSKATFMPIFLCGAVAVWIFQLLVRRKIDWTVAALVVLLAAVTAFAQIVLFGGQGGGMSLDPFATVRAALVNEEIAVTPMSRVVMLLTLLVSWLLYGVGALGLASQGRWRDPRAIWMLVCIPAGIAVAFVFFRSGLSQLWFQRTVAELVVLMSAWGMAGLLPNPLTKRHAAVFGGVAAAAGLGVFVISSYLESGRDVVRQATYHTLIYTVLAPAVIVAVYLGVRFVTKARGSRPRPGPAILLSFLLGLGLSHVYALGYDALTGRHTPHPSHTPLFAAGGVDAAEYVAHHSSDDDIVATNVHCLQPDAKRCDNRNFWVSAYTERRVLIEGWGYTAATNKNFVAGTRNSYIPPPDPTLLKTNDAAFKQPSEQTVQKLVDTYDVSWLFVSKDYAADVPGLMALDSILTKKFDNSHYVVFKIKK
ncbi:MAG: hypothetical protein ABJA81_07515 [Nocardioidaceae bacterium]